MTNIHNKWAVIPIGLINWSPSEN